MRKGVLLNLDLLGLVCDSTNDVSTVLSLSLVSHAVRVLAAKRLLSMKPVTLKDERTIRAFHQFMFAGAESRLPFLRAMNISVDSRPIEEQNCQDLVKYILDLLEHATRLECLTLPYLRWTLDYLADSRIVEAITRISTLRELRLPNECVAMAEIVKSTRSASCLRILHISLSTLPSTRRFGYGVKVGALDECLLRLAPTLEVLLLDLSTGTLDLDTKGAQYPSLRSLTTNVGNGLMRMDILVHKFPALDGTLNIRSVCELLDDEPSQKRFRASNQERQKQRSWRHLDCVMSDTLALFVLGLTCPVRRLMVDDFHGDNKNLLVEILRSTPPTHLKLSVVLDHDEDNDDILRDLFPPEVLPRLTHLVLVLDYTVSVHDHDDENDEDDEKSIQWSAILAEIIRSISALHLTHLRLVVHYAIDLSDEYADVFPYAKDFVRNIVDMDHQRLAAELMHSVPSLQHVFVSTGGEFEVLVVPPGEEIMHLFGHSYPEPRRRGRWFAHSAWRNSNGRGGSLSVVNPEKLDENVMERMLLDEDLTLSDIDNYIVGFQKTWSEDETAPWTLPE
ncbi:uncharacterized protein TRAVEDRAFT_51316 [Trametes versicolor FP-101664 SS1]|uniref:uncharacterized protein n=1 Tax=Trametes versicolor (strain FP-101664) TaxID=717944 RepID=UPI00046228E8|nr:uncharacterized protein TRAVEDRAFT_51316 [Trametes versicolor FP-101664 SS1]EIW55187.1 hypothetical protein TRAVEDRAFT_51316 [Trametes versicolor FP-101664 SS1]